MTLDEAMEVVRGEVERAQAKFAPFNSTHEGWAVIREEIDELWDEVKANRGDLAEGQLEAIQSAAMCIRYLVELTR